MSDEARDEKTGDSSGPPEPYPLEESGEAGSDSEAPKMVPGPGPGRIEAPSLLDMPTEDSCPRCKAPLAAAAVFCLKCGYDLRTAEVRTTQTGVDLVKPSPEALKKARPEFSPSDRGTVKMIAIAGAAMTLAAMIGAAVFSPVVRPSYVFGKVALTLLETLIHTGTGIVAVVVAARIADMRLGRIDLVAAKVWLAFATFELLGSIVLPGPARPMEFLMFIAAGAAYWGLLMLLFGRNRMDALTVVVVHFVLFLVLNLTGQLSGCLHEVRREEEAKAAKFAPEPASAPGVAEDPALPGAKP